MWVKRAPARTALLAIVIGLTAFNIQFALIFARETHWIWILAVILWLPLMHYSTVIIRQTTITGIVQLILRGWDWMSRRTKR